MKEQDISLRVTGMTCTNCALGLKRYLEKQGFEDVSVDFAQEQARFRAQTYDAAKVRAGVARLGFEVVPVGADGPTRRRFGLPQMFVFCLLLTLPLLAAMFLPFPLLHNPYVQLALALPVYAVGAWHFGRSGWGSLRTGVPNMDVLIITGATAAFVYSLTGTLLGLGPGYLFYETAASIITTVLLGNLLEHRSVQRTTSAIGELVKLQNPKATLVETDARGHERLREVATSAVRVGQLLQVNAGAAVPVDGTVEAGRAGVDESMLTGESLPVGKQPGDAVAGGTLVADGSLRVRATAVGADTTLGQIIELVKNAQARKPALQNLADRVSAIFVPTVLAVATLTFLINYGVADVPFREALLRGVAVLVIACPCAMGLAVPTAVMVGVGQAARRGVLVRGADTLETLTDVKTVVFDKTGTLTTGRFRVEAIDVYAPAAYAPRALIYHLEKHSDHPLAQSLQRALADEATADLVFDEVTEEKGCGLSATLAGRRYALGSARWLARPDWPAADLYLTEDDRLVASVRLSDELKPEAQEVVDYFHRRDIETALLSGDRREKCEALARQIGIKTVYAEQRPDEKLAVVERLSAVQSTAMVGDGINDAPALARATVGISLSNATRVAVQSAEVILLRGDLRYLRSAFETGFRTVRTIRQNLFWAFFYNVLAIPLAAVGLLSPMIAALAMALSDVVVIFNSLRLKVSAPQEAPTPSQAAPSAGERREAPLAAVQ